MLVLYSTYISDSYWKRRIDPNIGFGGKTVRGKNALMFTCPPSSSTVRNVQLGRG